MAIAGLAKELMTRKEIVGDAIKRLRADPDSTVVKVGVAGARATGRQEAQGQWRLPVLGPNPGHECRARDLSCRVWEQLR
jgi:hypothetical protein